MTTRIRRAETKPASTRPGAKSKPATARNAVRQKNTAVAPDGFAGAGRAHNAAVELSTDARWDPAAKAGAKITEQVMGCIGSYDKSFLLDSDGLRSHVLQVSTRFMAAVDQAQAKGSIYQQLQKRYPGASVVLVGTASVNQDDQVYYLVRSKDGQVRKFENVGGKPVEKPDASGEIFMAAELNGGKRVNVRVPDVKFLINPTLPPSYGVGRTIDVVMDTPIDAQKRNAGDTVNQEMDGVYKEILPGTQKGEDGTPLGVILQSQREEKGVILKFDGNQTYDVQVTQPDGTQKVVQMTEDQIRTQNDPTVYNLHGSTYDDVTINVDQDPSLKKFLDQAQQVADKDIPKSGTPEQIAAGQKQCLVDLTILCNKTMSYPDEDPKTTDAGSQKWQQLANAHSNWNPMKLGDLIDCGRGVCRHQAILMQLACQTAGISSRTVSASANDQQGNFRGYHAFLETTLDDGSQYLTDPTWFDAGPVNVSGYTNASPVVNGQIEKGTPLWDTLYFNVERQVLPSWNSNDMEDHNVVKFQEDNNPVIDSAGNVVTWNAGQVNNGTPPADTSALLKDVRVTEYGSDYDSWWPNWDPKQATQAQYQQAGDSYANQNDPKDAAVYYSLGIQFGSAASPAGTKQLWQSLAKSLSQVNDPKLQNDAQQVQTIASSM